jgi:integrase/recombinase XerD
MSLDQARIETLPAPPDERPPAEAGSSVADEVDRFAAWLAQRGLCHRSVDCYTADTERFGLWLARRGDALERATPKHIKTWIERYPCATTANRKLSALRSFYTMLLERRAVKSNPAANIPTRAIASRQGVIKSPSDLALTSLFESLAKTPGAPHSTQAYRRTRDLAIFSLVVAAGLRSSEAVEVRVDDVTLSDRTVRVGLPNRRRVLSFDALTAERLAAWIEQRALYGYKNGRTPSDHLFISDRARGMTRQALWKSLRQYAAAAGVTLNPRALRVAGAVRILSAGGPHVGARLLGVEVDATRAYALDG